MHRLIGVDSPVTTNTNKKKREKMKWNSRRWSGEETFMHSGRTVHKEHKEQHNTTHDITTQHSTAQCTTRQHKTQHITSNHTQLRAIASNRSTHGTHNIYITSRHTSPQGQSTLNSQHFTSRSHTAHTYHSPVRIDRRSSVASTVCH
jgi:hypothetical protein